MITKEKFVNYLKDVENEIRFEEELHSFYYSHNASEPYDTPQCMDTVVDILDDIFSPEDRDVSYFCFELDFGKDFKDGCVVDNGVNVDFSSAEALYDYLVGKNK